MSQVVVDISVSLDGYVTGPNVSLDNGLGDGGEALHSWVFEGNDQDQKVLDDAFEGTGRRPGWATGSGSSAAPRRPLPAPRKLLAARMCA